MYTDFYIRNEDGKTIQDILEITDELSLLISQIEMCLFTNKYDVIGQQQFGVNLEELLFTFDSNEAQVKDRIMKTLYSYCPLAYKYQVDVDVRFKNGEMRDIGFIDILVNGDSVFGLVI